MKSVIETIKYIASEAYIGKLKKVYYIDRIGIFYIDPILAIWTLTNIDPSIHYDIEFEITNHSEELISIEFKWKSL